MNKTIIAVCNHKGGFGKTTIAVALAQHLTAKHRVLLIEIETNF